MSGWTPTPSGLQFADTAPGGGPAPRPGAWVWVHYTGWLVDEPGGLRPPAGFAGGAPSAPGLKFDSSRDRGGPFAFRLGMGDVIPAWDEAVATMRVGGKREIFAPPHLAYGAQGMPGLIPPNAWLRFEIEMLATQ